MCEIVREEMAKGSNNIRSKKPHSSKPYDVSNSFVKKVTSGVSSLLPQSSWFSRWFTSNSNAEEDKTSSANDGEKPEDDLSTQSPPCKRARIPLNRPFPANSFRVSSPIDRGETHPWPSESITSPIPNVFSDSPIPGPSGLGRTAIATNAFQSPSPNTESLEGKINGDGGSDSSESTSGCSSLAPQRNTSSGSITTLRSAVSNKFSNHMLQFSLFPSGTHKLSPTVSTSISKRRPSFNVSSFASPNLDSSKTSRDSSLNSPFYIGRTMYGGASAYRRPRDGIPSESLMSSSRRGGVTVRPANEKNQSASSAEAGMSQTARRILEALEQFSSPVSEARRMPLPSQPALSAKRKRPLDSSPVKSSNPPAAAINPLTIPVPPERLRLHRLQDVTEAARQLASSRSDSRVNYTLRPSDETTQHSLTGKVTKFKPLNENERSIPVNLPNIPLPITSLPSFGFCPLPQITSSSSALRKEIRAMASKITAMSEQIGASAEVESSKIPCATSSSAVLSIASNAESTVATTSSGMKPFNVLHDINSDAFKTKCDRKSEITLSNTTQPNLKTVSFADTVSFKFNKSIDSSSKIDKSNVSSCKTSSSNSKANEFVFSTPTVLPTTRSKETSESKMNNFYFCKPEVLEITQCDKISRKEPNGFHKRSLRSGNDESFIKQISANDKTEKGVTSSGNELEVKKSNQSGKSSRIENNGWSTKFVIPESWECSQCMVRNKKDLEVCVCCEGKRPNASSTTLGENTTGKPSDGSSVPKSSWGSKFQLQPGMWECSACLVRNKESDVKCISCTTTRKSVNIPAQQESCHAGSWGSQFKMSSDMWECSTCLVRNKEQDTKCVSCTTPCPAKIGEGNSANKATKTSDDWGQKLKKGAVTWECPVCMIRNKDSLIKCAACEEPKPGLNKNSVGSGSSIKFNFEIPSAASSFKFGIDKADSKTAETSTPSSFQFGCDKLETAKGQSGFSFGTSETKVTTTFTFGIPQPPSSSSAPNISKPSKLDTSGVPNVTSGVTSTPTTSANASSKTCVPPETSKVSGFSFGSASEVPTEPKKLNASKIATSGSEPSGKDLQFGAPQASGSNEDTKTGNTPVTKPGQSNSNENKNFNFGTPSAVSTPAAFNFLTSVTTPTTITCTDTTSSSALVAPVSSTIPGGTTTSVTRTSSIFSFGSNSSSSFSKPPTSSTPTFSFKGSGTQSTPSGIFGTTTPNQFKTSNEGLFSNKAAVSTVAPVFGTNSSKTTTVHTFGTTPTTTASAPTFSAPSSAVFSPGSTCTTASFGSGTSKPILASATSFGSVTTSTNASVSSPVVASTPGTGSNFVATTASFGVPTTTVSLTMTSPTFPTTTTSTNFAMPASTSTVTSSSSTPAFGTSVAFGAPATTSNTFGITSASPNFTTTASNIFGSTNTPSFGASANPGFGSTTTSQNFGSSFGVVTTTPVFGTTTPAVSTVASTPTLSVFGGFSSSSKPTQGLFLFGSTPTSTALGSNFAFNNPAQTGATLPTATGAPGFSFGSASVTSVTTSTTTTTPAVATASAAATPAQGFGGFSFTPGGAAPAPSTPGLFGNTTPSVPGFGSNTASTPSAPTFGAGNAAGSNVFRPPAFGFGSGGSQQPFTFGSTAQPGTNQASGNTAFSFGQSQPQPTVQSQPQPLQFNPNVRPTFNFTGGETPQFTAAAPSTPTLQRRVKKAVRRSQRP